MEQLKAVDYKSKALHLTYSGETFTYLFISDINLISSLNSNISLTSMNLQLYKTMKFQAKVQKYTIMIRINLHETIELLL